PPRKQGPKSVIASTSVTTRAWSARTARMSASDRPSPWARRRCGSQSPIPAKPPAAAAAARVRNVACGTVPGHSTRSPGPSRAIRARPSHPSRVAKPAGRSLRPVAVEIRIGVLHDYAPPDGGASFEWAARLGIGEVEAAGRLPAPVVFVHEPAHDDIAAAFARL